ncbi:MAG: hypothetical protein RLZZ347_759 [Candidatus Parcubacteria bacterium]|jgi:SAM-dependent methyltransferase/chorismate mutase
MQTLLDLKELGKRLKKIDMLILALLKRRMDLALQVGAFKIKEKQTIFRSDVEDSRLAEFREWAIAHKMNPHFAEAIFYLIIGESCKQQMIQLQASVGIPATEVATEEDDYRVLRENLLLLAAEESKTYNDSYATAFFATRTYLDFEIEIIKAEIAKLSNTDVALDLGCATGTLTRILAGHFKKVVGYDISPEMIAVARSKEHTAASLDLSFEVVDIENGLPNQDNSVSFVAMSLGTASDIRNIQTVILEIKRVLKPGGRFLCSFYNREALLYRWDFMPWPVALAAEINPHKNCLDVHYDDKVLSVYARPYSVEEVRQVFSGALDISSVLTYPTLSPILPNDLFENQPEVQTAVAKIERTLLESGTGAYILVTGEKPM